MIEAKRHTAMIVAAFVTAFACVGCAGPRPFTVGGETVETIHAMTETLDDLDENSAAKTKSQRRQALIIRIATMLALGRGLLGELAEHERYLASAYADSLFEQFEASTREPKLDTQPDAPKTEPTDPTRARP